MATTTTNVYAPDAAKSKFKAVVQELYRKKKDPNFVRYAMERQGYDISLVDQELASLSSYETGQPVQTPKVDQNAVPGSKLNQLDLTAAQQTALLYGQRTYQSGKILDTLDNAIAEKGLGASIKQKIDEMNVGGTITNQFVPKDFQQYDQAKRDFVNATLRRESGAVISPTEFDNAEKQYFPRPGDSQEVVAQKKANRELVTKGLLKSAGVQDAEINFNSESTPTKTAQPNDQVTQAKAWLEANPTDPRAEKVKAKIAQMETTTTTNAGLNVNEQPSGTNTDFTAMGGDAGQAVGGFLGGNKIGEAIGNAVGGVMAKYGEAGKTFQKTLAELAQAKADGKLTEEKYNSLVDMQEKAAKDAFGYDGPSFRQVAGDAAKVALTVLGGAEVKGATWLATVGRSALWGAGYGAADAQSEGKGLVDTAKESAYTAALSALIPAGGKFVSKAFKSARGTNNATEALGEILQGKTKDLKAGERVFKVLDTKGVQTYEDLGARVDDLISASSKKVDELLSSEGKVFSPQELITKGKTEGGKVVETNYVTQAIEHLRDFAKNSGDSVSAGNFEELLGKANSQGLSTLELNQLARKYGMEFGDKAFNKLGDAKTSVSAQLYENVRSGLKKLARNGVNGDVAKNLDGLISDAYTVRDLVRKNIEKVNSLEQRVIKRGWGEKLGRALGVAVDTATGGVVSSMFKKLSVPSNMGNKSLNALGIEERLSSNLKILDEALNSKTYGAFESAIKKFNRSMIEKVKNIRPGMNMQDITPRGKEARKKLAEFASKMEGAKTEAIRNRYRKAIQNLIDTENKVKS